MPVSINLIIIQIEDNTLSKVCDFKTRVYGFDTT